MVNKKLQLIAIENKAYVYKQFINRVTSTLEHGILKMRENFKRSNEIWMTSKHLQASKCELEKFDPSVKSVALSAFQVEQIKRYSRHKFYRLTIEVLEG